MCGIFVRSFLRFALSALGPHGEHLAVAPSDVRKSRLGRSIGTFAPFLCHFQQLIAT